MNLKIRDHSIFWFHWALARMGKIRVDSLDEIQKIGFRNVLIVATTAIGDAVLCTPLIDSLRAIQPRVKIGFWVPAKATPLFENHSGLDALLPYYGKYRRLRQTFDLLRKGNYDLALVANSNDPDVIPVIWWSGCKRIIRRPQRHTIYSFMVANPEMLERSHTSGHAIERNLQFCDLLKIPRSDPRTRLDVRPEALARVRPLLEGSPSPWWIIHPGASRTRKQWGIHHYAKLARRILTHQNGTVILTGSRDEIEACDQIQSKIELKKRVCNLGGKLQLDEIAALFSKAHLLISGDTGPYHIAMAVGTATVTLFAPWDPGSSPQINGPYFDLKHHPIVETKCMGDSISTISVDTVFETCKKFFL